MWRKILQKYNHVKVLLNLTILLEQPHTRVETLNRAFNISLWQHNTCLILSSLRLLTMCAFCFVFKTCFVIQSQLSHKTHCLLVSLNILVPRSLVFITQRFLSPLSPLNMTLYTSVSLTFQLIINKFLLTWKSELFEV